MLATHRTSLIFGKPFLNIIKVVGVAASACEIRYVAWWLLPEHTNQPG